MEIASSGNQSQMEPGTGYGGLLLPCQLSGMATYFIDFKLKYFCII